MDTDAIRAALSSANPQERMRGLVALRDVDTQTAVPLLISKLRDPEFVARSFVAMGLGRHRTDEAFAALLTLLHEEGDYNVRAEAANSLSLYGSPALPHLLRAFEQDDHWLVRRSILSALVEMPYPEALYQVAAIALADSDPIVRESGIDGLNALAQTSERERALQLLLPLVSDEWWRVRLRVTQALKAFFEDGRAMAALAYLAKDEDERVRAAAT
ncbi:HEAT repeat domain-containing protein [Gloeobacter kilaueensis]|uniref:Oxidoreductase/HEAT repeat-containing protein n=1 Tax=Gloeobacter kilaueensis (strain ATCC BAA-2537 / CCAP 1431/1 / ULC 316 / JS1) TaxID=1183438 RepID=U5QNS7_GLOK1|nr:HEAT repeat domain-containing protein [Gloeobacter kilaueensis]AGY60538.1 oxidoreductase/HEAT repeat-containing protein [Gloeobacter kilaueensis JS1]